PVSTSLVSYLSRAHRDLHSFPTRRSSDLVVSQAVRELGDRVGGGGGDQVDVGPRDELEVAGRLVRRGCLVGKRAPSGVTLELAGDRKSTRLNSSHVAISYAVFCLKKKKSD